MGSKTDTKCVVIDVGCIECGESTTFLGVFSSEEKAQKAIDGYLEPGTRWGKEGWHGQHEVGIYDFKTGDAL